MKRSSSLCMSRRGRGGASSVANSTSNVSAATSENDSENEVFLTPCPLLKSVKRTVDWQER